MEKPVIAAQLFTVRELLAGKSEEEIRKVLSEISEMGYTAIQISGIGEVTPEAADIYEKAALDFNLDICATHFALDYMEDNTDWVIEIHKKWQCSYVGVGSMPDDLRFADKLDSFIGRMNALGKKFKDSGVQLIYHNHKFEFEQIDGKPWLQYLLDNFDINLVQLEIDTYWVQAGGANPVTWINKVSGNMGVLHLKDFRIVGDEQRFAEIGEGNLEWVPIIEAANDGGVTYAAVEQDSFTEDPLESLRMSINYLNTL